MAENDEDVCGRGQVLLHRVEVVKALDQDIVDLCFRKRILLTTWKQATCGGIHQEAVDRAQVGGDEGQNEVGGLTTLAVHCYTTGATVWLYTDGVREVYVLVKHCGF